jgi:gliding motility-associated-like protein
LRVISTIKFRFLFLIITFLLGTNAFAQMEFVQNKGQWNNRVQYKASFKTGAFFLEQKGFTVLLHNPEDLVNRGKYYHAIRQEKGNVNGNDIFHSHAYTVSFVGADANAERIPDKPLPTYNNYFIGNEKANWASDCKLFYAVTYKNVYPNIDVRYYSTQNNLKYDFIVHPGGNPALIAMQYDGVNSLAVKNKELIIGTSVGTLKELSPYTYQTGSTSSSTVLTKYKVKDNTVTLDVEDYDKNATLVIDPQLIFSSFTGSSEDNWGYAATPGADGSFFSGGIVFGSGFPVSIGALQTTFAGGDYDIAIFRFSANGSARVYATYIGGSEKEQPHSMIADAAGNLIVAGRTNSPNYPLLTSIPSTGSGYDIVITKINNTGTAILGSAKIGGSGDDGVNMNDKAVPPFGDNGIRRNYGDDAKSEVLLDASNNIILASCTQSSDFPTINPVQSTFGGSQDGIILKLTSNINNIIFATYFGGVGDDACFAMAINPLTNNLYIAGATTSNNLPGSTTSTIAPSFIGDIDGFITSLQPNGSAIIKTSYIGTTDIDLVYGVKFDRFGFPYIMGTTTGTWVPINATYNVPGSKQFIAKLQPDLSSYIYSTNFGTNATLPNISPIAFLVDRCENVYVSGWGGNVNGGYSNSGTLGLPEVNPIAGLPAADGSDFYFFVLKKNAQSQLFGSHFGQDGGTGDHVDGGTSRFDDNGIIYQSLCANCFANGITFPTTQGVWSTTNNSTNCNLAAVKIDMNFAGIAAEIQSSIAGVLNDTLGCVPVLVNFKDTLQKGVTYYWNFNSVAFPNAVDAITTHPDTAHLFTAVGIYRVRLISEDLSTCNLRDTAYITINISDRLVTPKFKIDKVGPCATFQYQFTNLSFNSDGTAFTTQSFEWDYGDGSPKDTANLNPPRMHTYASIGTYLVKLTAIDPRFCNTPIFDTIRLKVAANLKAKTNPVAFVCGQSSITFDNISDGGVTWKWEVLDISNNIIATSTDFQPTFTFPLEGTYKYRLIAFDPTTCNTSDTTQYFSFRVLKNPVALFDYSPKPSEPNKPFNFINLSSFANRYLWTFGDGESSTLFEPTHLYEKQGTYTVILIAYNNICTDTFSMDVNTLINPLLDVPNAFTPGKFGENGVVYVRGFGIAKMDWRIYNRWGEVVFVSTNKKQGWDGYYKGKLQPMDVYTYSLDVELDDGVKIKRTGDITLLR